MIDLLHQVGLVIVHLCLFKSSLQGRNKFLDVRRTQESMHMKVQYHGNFLFVKSNVLRAINSQLT